MNSSPLNSKISAAISRVDLLLKQLTLEKCHVTHFGATEVDPKYLAVWLCVQSDHECERLYQDIMSIREQVHHCFGGEQYPAAAVPFIGVQIASQETVNREYAGNWWHFFK